MRKAEYFALEFTEYRTNEVEAPKISYYIPYTLGFLLLNGIVRLFIDVCLPSFIR